MYKIKVTNWTICNILYICFGSLKQRRLFVFESSSLKYVINYSICTAHVTSRNYSYVMMCLVSSELKERKHVYNSCSLIEILSVFRSDRDLSCYITALRREARYLVKTQILFIISAKHLIRRQLSILPNEFFCKIAKKLICRLKCRTSEKY